MTQQLKVGALIVGTQKGGTSALFHFLSQHPLIDTPQGIKEVHFFDDEALFASGPPNYALYHQAFGMSRSGGVRLEATPIYMYWRPCAPRIAAYNPAIQLIFILRDPVERAVSQWEMEYSRGTEMEQFPTALEREREHAKASPTEQHRVRSYVDRGFYGAQVERLLGYFPRSQMLLLKHEELRDEHERTLDRVCSFLGVAPFANHPVHRLISPTEKARDLPPVPVGLRGELRRQYAQDLARLRALTGLDCGAWLRG